ncbi:sensor histidine kinase [Actinomadura sp. 9N407]|uniref:sensor histidine kinase n=1 Tax=Actinomadura sp. 9N407 TaxID=3375154 RepID=UPI00378EAB97
MSSENSGSGGAGETFRILTRPIVWPYTALVTGRADPLPPDRPWPFWLRWTWRFGAGRMPFSLATQILDMIIAVATLFGTYSLLQNQTAKTEPFVPHYYLFICSLALSLPLAMRQRHPVGAWRLSVFALLVTSVHGWMLDQPNDMPYVPGGVFVLILVLYTVAVRSPRGVTIGAGLTVWAGAFLIDQQNPAGPMVVVLLPLLAGYLVRQRHLAGRELEERDEAAQRELAEQERRHRDTEAVLKERQRIARELHDVVAHHMSMIAIQAEAAPYTVPEVPDKIRSDLAEIRATALDALTEMRRILGVLRSEDGAETAPQPGLERLDTLLAGTHGTGLSVHTKVVGELDGLPQGVSITAYRILQEALSNAMRHAPGSRVDVELIQKEGILLLSVINGPPSTGERSTLSPPGSGHGLVGMRERAAMLHGGLTAKPTPEGGFAVTATLPLRPEA